MANGVELNRVSLLLAVMEKRLGLHLSGQDVYVNVVGGIQIDEPAIDLGLVAAITSSLRESPIDHHTMVVGEVGLGGEVRAISQADLRIREAAKMGFRRCLLPERNVAKLDPVEGIELIGIREVGEALDAVLSLKLEVNSKEKKEKGRRGFFLPFYFCLFTWSTSSAAHCSARRTRCPCDRQPPMN